MKFAGILAVIFYVIHATVHLLRHEPWDLFWACNLAVLLVGIALLTRNATLNAIAVLWAAFGTALWALDLATGGEWLPTAVLTHIGALVIGIFGVRALSMPRFAALKSLAAFALLWCATRVITPPKPNVNLAFRVAEGWHQYFPSFALYTAMLGAVALAVFAFVARALEKTA